MEKWKERRKRSLEEAFEFSWAKADLGKVNSQSVLADGMRRGEVIGLGQNNKTGQRWWDEWTTERVGGKSTRPRPPGGKENVRREYPSRPPPLEQLRDPADHDPATRDDYHKVLAHPDLAGTAKYEHDHNPT